jgi:hypothetical protein
MAAWVAYNALVRDTSTFGQPTTGGASVADNVRSALDVLGRWALPAGGPRPALGVAVLAIVVTAAVAAVLQERRQDGAGLDRAPRPSILPFALFAVAYPVVLALLSIYEPARLDLDDERFLAPAWPAAVLVVLTAVGWSQRRRAKVVVGLGAAALAVWLVLLAGAAARDWYDLHQHGNGFGADVWEGSPLVDAAASLPPDTVILANEAAGLAHLAGRPVLDLETVDRGGDPRPDPTVVAWFDDPDRFDSVSPPRPTLAEVEAATGLRLDPRARVPDGALYDVTDR